MWTDERGSEVLDPPECRRLLAIGAKEHLPGHLAVADGSVPLVLPLDYSVHESDIIVRVGEGLFSSLVDRLVAFEVDGRVGHQGLRGIEDVCEWSVLAQGLATEVKAASLGRYLPQPRVAEPGHRLVRIRTDVLTGRRLHPAGS
ncbi:MAG TPA: pyridoxamine 5'-phosphate oxidase family protein [Acidimicrobiales bacterium]|nr:pyridoxamine 5'-phosphate oxidase family protein [Acidimicrobiales bacterium]